MSIQGFFTGFKNTLASRDAASYWGPALKGATALSDSYFKTNFYPTIRGIVSDANALSGVTYVVDGANAARRGFRDGSLVEWIGAIFFSTSLTDASSIACENGHCPGETESSVVQFINSVGDLSKAVWTWDRVQEIKEEDYVKGAQGQQERLAQTRKYVDLVRYSIWTVSALSTVLFSYLAAQGNFFAQMAGSFAEEHAVSFIINGVRGALGLMSFIIGLNLVGRAPALNPDQNRIGYQNVDAAKRAMGPQQARDAAKTSDEFNTIFDKAQYIVNDRKKTRTASKVVRLGLWVVENLSNAVGWAGTATGAANFSNWLKNKQTFCKVVAVPSWIASGIKNSQRDLNASAAKAWLEWCFVGTYDVCAVPTYLFDKAGAQMPTNTKWFLKEATRHWCSLFQAAALVIEFGYNVESRPHNNVDGVGARERFANGAAHLIDGTAMDEANWRDTLYLADRVAVIAMTALTLYRWVCDARGEKFKSFGALMLVFDATKAGANLAKELWEDQDDSGFIGKQAEAYLKKYGAPAAA